MNFVSGSTCYFDDNTSEKCFPTECNNIKPSTKEWVIYGVSWCPFCRKTLEHLKEKKIAHYYYDVENPPFNTKENFRSMMSEELNGHHTLPAIFHHGKLIGGYTDLMKVSL